MIADFYHCRLKALGRNAGRSAVACAAYRAGLALEDERYGLVRDFTRKSDVVTQFTVAPDGAPAWAHDVTQLWNHVEAFEKRKDAQLAYEWEVALPNKLDDASREAIARDFAGWLVDTYGVAVTVGIHEGHDRGNGLNDHMHCMMTRRGVNQDGFEKKILPQFSVNPRVSNPEVTRVRERAADLINGALDEAGSDTRVSHLSFEARGITDREPTKHLGPAATAYERQGYETDRGDINREIRQAIAERLAWQQEQAQPEVDAAVARDLAARFGDPTPPQQAEADHAQRLKEAQAGGLVPVDIVAHATADAAPMPADMTGKRDRRRRAHIGRCHRERFGSPARAARLACAAAGDGGEPGRVAP